MRVPTTRRPGTIVPMLAVCVVALFSFVALAVDLGMLMVARSESQNAADAAALIGARTLDNRVPTGTNPDGYDNNMPAAVTAARTGVTNNILMQTNFTAARVTSVQIGVYDYDATVQTFQTTYPGAKPSGKAWGACRVQVNGDQPSYFSRLFGVTSMPTGAIATAVHRPRDIAMVLDFTGSMGYSSLFNTAALASTNGTYNSPDTVYPSFAHYARYAAYTTNSIGGGQTGAVGSRPHPFVQTGTRVYSPYVLSPGNFSVTTANGPAIVKDFYYDPANLSSPTATALSPTAASLRNAFDATGFDALNRTGGGVGPTPAPAAFADQSDAAYVGDKFPRKWGAATGTTWDPTDPNGATVTLTEFLKWTAGGAKYTGGTTVPGLTTSVSGRTAANFRDATWERYGYDLDVAHYVANRNAGGTWDPRFDRLNPTALPTAGLTYNASVTPGKFKGYSMGPGYWGKTFFMWPPDPRAPVGHAGDAAHVPGDWRRRFFLERDGTAFATGSEAAVNPLVAGPTGPLLTDAQVDADGTAAGNQNVNEKLFTNGAGSTLLSATNNYTVNYAAVLKWLKGGPPVLPPNLRAGRVRYYTSIPDDANTAAGTADEKADKQFWKQYIDYVLTGGLTNSPTGGELAGFEPARWPEGTTYSNPVSGGLLSGYVNPPTVPAADPRPYMSYQDNPSRPRMHFWFGPLSMIAFIDSRNMLAGTTRQAQCWQLKTGVNSALDDIKANHPNDRVGMSFFCTPGYTSIMVPMGQDWSTLKNSLFFPRSLLPTLDSDPSAELRPYSGAVTYTGIGDVPNAQNSTDPNSGLALAFNMLSPSPSVNADPNRRGRRGAAKIVIFETDGVPNASQRFSLQPQGYNSYYNYNGGSDPLGPSGAALAVVAQIAKPTAGGTSGDSGHSLPNAPARVYAIGFGDIFSTSAGPTARTFLDQIQAGTGLGAVPDYQIITGAYDVRIENLRNALERILQSGVQVTLIE